MGTPSSAIHNLATRLLTGQPAVEPVPGDADLAIRACEKLRVPLTKLAGATGFSSLLNRALVLARRQVPSLQTLQVGADGSLVRSPEAHDDPGSADAGRQGAVALLAELLALLITFVGEPLVLSLLREAWPEATPEVLNLTTEAT